MNVVIFTHNEFEAKKIGQEILDKLYLLGICNISNHGRTFKFPAKNIVIDVFITYSSTVLDLNPRYFLIDDTCSYDFQAFIRQQFITLNDAEEAYNLKDLILKVIEYALYGDD